MEVYLVIVTASAYDTLEIKSIKICSVLKAGIFRDN